MSALPIRVFIGTEEKTNLQYKVLKYSIEKYAKYPVDFIPLKGDSWENNKDRPFKIGTGFSLERWNIPFLCQYKGYAIYLDVDMLVFTDIKRLWEADVTYLNKQASVWCTHQNGHWETSCMFIDCERAAKQFPLAQTIIHNLQHDKDRKYYKSLMHGLELEEPPQCIPNSWNHLNTLDKTTNILHYTIEHQQPWYKPNHPLRIVWEEHLLEALKCGDVTADEIKVELARYDCTPGKRIQGLHPYYKRCLK